MNNKLLNLKEFNKLYNTNFQNEYGSFKGYNKIYIVVDNSTIIFNRITSEFEIFNNDKSTRG
tara:strand:- start:235 stop:420 length:186 start_codon:yes stop_codon:yes gene_type:complete